MGEPDKLTLKRLVREDLDGLLDTIGALAYDHRDSLGELTTNWEDWDRVASSIFSGERLVSPE